MARVLVVWSNPDWAGVHLSNAMLWSWCCTNCRYWGHEEMVLAPQSGARTLSMGVGDGHLFLVYVDIHGRARHAHGAARYSMREHMNTRTHLGAMLVLHRAAHQWTVRDLAPKVGISIATLSRIERGYAMDADTMLTVLQWLLSKVAKDASTS